MESDEIKTAMDGQSVTQGWDAIAAYNATQVTSVFFQQYLQEGPTNPALPVRVILNTQGSDFWLLDLKLGPPDIAFSTNLNWRQCQVTMFLVKGVLLDFDADQQIIKSVLRVRPNESWVTGEVNLGQVTGTENQLGQVIVDLGAGAYQPQISGIFTGSLLSGQIGTALLSFFQNNDVVYPLGVIALSNVPPSLQPTQFDFITQPAPDGPEGDGCVVVFIQTNGTQGSLNSLTPYPIPSGATAAVVVSNQVIFNQLMPAVLTQKFQNYRTQFSGQKSNGGWQVVGSGGSINLGVLGDTNGHDPYSSDSNANEAAVVVSTDGFVLSPQGGNLSGSWGQSWDQYWTYWYGSPDPNGGVIWSQMADDTPVQANYSLSTPPSVDPNTDIVSFSSGGQATFGPINPPSWFTECVLPQYQVEDQFSGLLQSKLQGLFASLPIPSVNIFAISNLLFPSRYDQLSLNDASLPFDLLVTGQLGSALKVSPATVNLEPGATQQFTAALSGKPTTAVTWMCKPNVGSIDANGLYTAPAKIDDAEAVVITAINNNDEENTASSMVLVYNASPATGLLVTPADLILTQGNPFDLLVTDESGNPVDAICSLSPNIGTLAQEWSTGSWKYLPPENITDASQVTVNAVSKDDSSQQGKATIQLVPVAQVQITPASSNLTANQSVILTASSDTLDEFTWVVNPIGAGSIVLDQDDSGTATYTAPASVPSDTEVMVAAYSLGSNAVGIGLARVSLAKS